MFDFNKYIELEEIYRYHLNACYKVKDRESGISYIIKEHAEKQLLLNEKNILKQISGITRVPKFYDYYEEDEKSYLVIEHIDGITLEKVVAKTVLSDDEIMQIGAKISAILDKINSRNIYHCDLKMSNVVINNEDEVFLIDFGTARTGEQLENQRHIHDTKSSPYTAETDCADARDVDKVALGKLLFRMISRCGLEKLFHLNLKYVEEYFDSNKTDRNLSYCILRCIRGDENFSLHEMELMLKRQKKVALVDYVKLVEEIEGTAKSEIEKVMIAPAPVPVSPMSISPVEILPKQKNQNMQFRGEIASAKQLIEEDYITVITRPDLW